MRVYKREFSRLSLARSFVDSHFPDFGINKRQEIIRLLYEISKREEIPIVEVIKDEGLGNYDGLKKYLIKRRYPDAFFHGDTIRPYLPQLELKVSQAICLKEKRFYPKNIFIEKKAAATFLAKRFKELFPKSHFCEIDSLKEFNCARKGFTVEDYNRRRDTVFIVSEGYDFFKKCPCTSKSLGCGYHVCNLGFGCLFECTYCFLQEYTNTAGILLPANIDRFFDTFDAYRKNGIRIGTGEFSDSLALDEFTQYSIPIIAFFSTQKDVTFEFKTKSISIRNILDAHHAGNIVISWSLNPQGVIDDNEFLTPSLKARLSAALKCVNAGYKAGFHFDPVIYFEGWENRYALLIENLFEKIHPKHIAWISIGTLRFSPGLKPVIEKRFPGNKILNEELLLGYDNKLRYPYIIRHDIYKKILGLLLKHSSRLKIYLCMEDFCMWKDLGLKMPDL